MAIPVLLFQRHQFNAVRDIILLVILRLALLAPPGHTQVLRDRRVVLVVLQVHIVLRQFRVLFLAKLVTIALVSLPYVQLVRQVLLCNIYLQIYNL